MRDMEYIDMYHEGHGYLMKDMGTIWVPYEGYGYIDMYHEGHGYLMRDVGRLVGGFGIWAHWYIPSNSCNDIVQPFLKVTPEIWTSW